MFNSDTSFMDQYSENQADKGLGRTQVKDGMTRSVSRLR